MTPVLQAILFGSSFYPGATLALDFLAQKYRAPGINSFTPDFATVPGLTVTRATPAVSWDTTGTYSFPANVARIVPGVGLLVEEARTNLFLNSFAPATQTITITAQSYTITVWGTGSVTVAAGTATISNGGAASAGSPRTIGCTVGGTITVTVTGSPSIVQVEAGLFGTSPVPTLGAPVTRALDVVSIGGVSPIAAYTLFSEVGPRAAGSIAQQGAISLNDGTSANRATYVFRNVASNFTVTVVSGSAAQYSPTDQGVETGVAAVQRMALSLTTNLGKFAANGVVTSTDVTITLPVATATLRVGDDLGSSPLNGYVRKAVVYPSAYGDAQLQALTA